MLAHLVLRSLFGGRARFGVALAAIAVPAALVTAAANFTLDAGAKMTREFRLGAPNVILENRPGAPGPLDETQVSRALSLLPGVLAPDPRPGPCRRELAVAGTAREILEAIDRINAGEFALRARIVPILAAKEAAVLGKLRSLLLLVLALILAASAIAMGASLTAVVTERRTEIGLLKALGASEAKVQELFLSQIGLLLALGLVGGGAIGVGLSDVMGRGVFGAGTTLRPAALGIAALACALVAGLSSIVPLRRAFRVEPALVLKEE
jgi:hypothetical protein